VKSFQFSVFSFWFLSLRVSKRVRGCLNFTLFFAAATAVAVDFPRLSAPPAMFRAHREKFLSRLPPRSIAILRSAPARIYSNDTEYVYRQDSDLHYLTGLDEPDTTVVFRPDAPDGKRYILFVRGHDLRREAYEGTRPGPEGAVSDYGADAAFASVEFPSALAHYDPATRSYLGYVEGVETIYLADGGDAVWAEKLRDQLAMMRSRDQGPPVTVDARELLHEMRLVKDSDEITLLRRAAELSARGHVLAMKAAAPGKWEFEVQQALEGFCFGNGARMAYPSIVGSGPNSVFLHWNKNNRQMNSGEVVLNDSGAEYAYYASDVTRTYPVDGRFSPEQRAIYEIVLAAQKEAIGIIRPGVRQEEVESRSARVQVEGLLRLGLLSGEIDRVLKDNTYKKLTVHNVSHWVGLDVHDAGKYRVNGASRALEPGMVLTVEPGIYIPARASGVDPKWWNIGVRVEDTVLVTKDGSECLSCAAPREVADVEKTVLSGRK
jgi:Xaa-Pro aminopeptidase